MVGSDTTLTFYVQIGSICTAAVGLITVLVTRTWPWLKAKIDSRSVEKHAGAELYPAVNVERTIRYYVRPKCQDIDPSGGEEPRLVYGVKQDLFNALDDALNHPTEYRYLMLLADSGMGKTSAMINYYVRHIRSWRRWRRKYNLVIIPLGIPDADERIAAVENKSETIIFLDALDEDTLAIVDYVERLRLLIKATRDFRRVVISCRTQFFSKDEEIPKGTAILKVGSRAAGESAEYVFHKIYISPFSDEQVESYLKKRYPVWKRANRRRAAVMVKKIPYLAVRPMLLTHIDDLVKSKVEMNYPFELYEEMVKAWIDREEGFIQEKEVLRQFSELLAVNLYLNRGARGAEWIPKDELSALAKQWNISLDDWKLSGRSLLNRDASGNYKFAHRSILEYLFVKSFLDGQSQCLTVEWTDQMRTFLWEMLESEMLKTRALPFHNRTSNLYSMPVGELGASLIITTMQEHLDGVGMLPALLAVALDPDGHQDVNTIFFSRYGNAMTTVTMMADIWRCAFEPLSSYPIEHIKTSGYKNLWETFVIAPIVVYDRHAESYELSYSDSEEKKRRVTSISSINKYCDPSNSRSLLIIPVVYEGAIMGLFVAESPRRYAFSYEQMHVIVKFFETKALLEEDAWGKVVPRKIPSSSLNKSLLASSYQ
jgi:hypothetical protein